MAQGQGALFLCWSHLFMGMRLELAILWIDGVLLIRVGGEKL